MNTRTSTLAIHGGSPAIDIDPGDMFHWPIVTEEDETAVLEVLRAGTMSETEISLEFEREFAEWMGTDYALSYPNGTEALRAAMWAVGLAAGEEIICPSMTYWASAGPALTLGAAVHFADIDPDTLCIDPNDIEHRIGPKTRAIVVVHYTGHPCDMDRIMEIAERHNIFVIEDVSHAQGGLYKGRKLGSIGHISATSMMGGKSFAVGEGGMLATSNETWFERCIAYGFYERTHADTIDELKPYVGGPIGGHKHRMNQTCAAMGRVQLKYFDARITEIQVAMNRFWDLLEDLPGIRPHRTARDSGSTMGGWYLPRGLYKTEELAGLRCSKFCEAVRAEGVADCWPGANGALHLHEIYHSADLFRMGQPTMISFGQRDVRQGPGSLPVSESIYQIAFGVPWFKHDRPDIIEAYAACFRKVVEHADDLMKDD
jgi:dTDP-4-amino-4,6-dideoxygalactose transaminase